MDVMLVGPARVNPCAVRNAGKKLRVKCIVGRHGLGHSSFGHGQDRPYAHANFSGRSMMGLPVTTLTATFHSVLACGAAAPLGGGTTVVIVAVVGRSPCTVETSHQ